MILAFNVFRPLEVGIRADLAIRKVTINGCGRGVSNILSWLRLRKVIVNVLRLDDRIISVWQAAGYFPPRPHLSSNGLLQSWILHVCDKTCMMLNTG